MTRLFGVLLFALSAATAHGQDAKDLSIIDTKPGTGARAALRQCLYVHYVGMLPDGRVFEKSRDTASAATQPPIVFELGSKAVMQGWEKGLVGMQVGGTRRLWVPFKMAYGASGSPPAIPPRTDLIFDIELMAVAPSLPSSSIAERADGAKSCPTWRAVSRAR